MLIETDAEFSSDWLKQLLLPIINFYRTLDKEILPQMCDTVVQEVFNDFTDTYYARFEALARYLTADVEDEENAEPEDLSLAQVVVAFAQLDDTLQENRDQMLIFAQDVSDYYQLFQTKDYDQELKYDQEGNVMRLEQIQELEDKYTMSRQNVKMAKRLYKKDWIHHVYKLDGIVMYTKDNVHVLNYEDDYLPAKYAYLEKEQRDVGKWDDINSDGESIRMSGDGHEEVSEFSTDLEQSTTPEILEEESEQDTKKMGKKAWKKKQRAKIAQQKQERKAK